jgi:hypothetical protein
MLLQVHVKKRSDEDAVFSDEAAAWGFNHTNMG